MKLAAFFKKGDKNFRTLFVSAIIPMILFAVSFTAIIIYNYSTELNSTKQNTANILFQISDSCESKITSLTDVYDIINNIPAISDALTISEFSYNSATAQTLSDIRDTYAYLNDIYIYNQSQNTVYHSSDCHSADKFFTDIHPYTNYNLQYWNSFNFYHNEPFRILSPVKCSSSKGINTVIPVVFQVINDNQKKNYLIFDVNMKTLVSTQQITNGLTENSRIYILNKYTNDIFSTTEETNSHSFSNELIEQLLSSKKSSFSYKIDGKKTNISMYSRSNSIVGYTYFAIIPSGDIIQQILPNVLISFFVILIFLLISLFYTFRNTKNIYTPLKNIQSVLAGNNSFESSGDIFNDITSLASDVRSKLETVLPGAQEKYLINLLNSSGYFADDFEEQIISETLKFPFSLFSVLIVQVSPTQRLYDEYNSADFDRFKYGFYTVVKETFSELFDCYVLPAEHNMLYIIFNFQDIEATEKIDSTLNQLSEYIKNDVEYINLSVGKSGIHRDINGLKEAHSEALNDFKELEFSESQIILKKPDSFNFNISLDKHTQNELTSALLSANSDKVYQIISNTADEYKTATSKQKKELYNSILTIVLKVIRLKKIPFKDDKLEFEIIYNCLNQPPKSAYNEMMVIVDYLLKSLSSQKREIIVDYDQIIAYINNNFTFQDLSLKFLADYFNVNLSNLSAALKNRLPGGFHSYLTELRIEKAKKLLSTTKKSAQDIGIECGFSSSNTFFRVFKESTGITPTEFRRQQNSQKSLYTISL